MFLRVVILVFAATCCTARVIGKSLHTRHKYTGWANELQQIPTWSKLSLPGYRNLTLTYSARWCCGGTNSKKNSKPPKIPLSKWAVCSRPAPWNCRIAVFLALKSTLLPFPYMGYRLTIGWRQPVKGGRARTPSFRSKWRDWGLLTRVYLLLWRGSFVGWASCGRGRRCLTTATGVGRSRGLW